MEMTFEEAFGMGREETEAIPYPFILTSVPHTAEDASGPSSTTTAPALAEYALDLSFVDIWTL